MEGVLLMGPIPSNFCKDSIFSDHGMFSGHDIFSGHGIF